MKTKLSESIELLKTVNSQVNENNSYNDEKLAEIVNAVNLLLKAKLWYCNSTKSTDEGQRLHLSNLKSDKLNLISLISSL